MELFNTNKYTVPPSPTPVYHTPDDPEYALPETKKYRLLPKYWRCPISLKFSGNQLFARHKNYPRCDNFDLAMQCFFSSSRLGVIAARLAILTKKLEKLSTTERKEAELEIEELSKEQQFEERLSNILGNLRIREIARDPKYKKQTPQPAKVEESMETERVKPEKQKPASREWYEVKEVKGHQYVYKRWKDDNGRRKSKYVGRAEVNQHLLL